MNPERQSTETRPPLPATPVPPFPDLELPAGGLDLRDYLRNVEDRLVQQALVRSRGVIAHAAKLLGLRRTTLAERLRKSRARARN